MNRGTTFIAGTLFVIALLAGITAAEAQRGRSTARAKPPQWDLSVLEVFFADATKELRNVPDVPNGTPVPDDASTKPEMRAPSETPESGRLAWSKLIDAEALEDEVKTLAPMVAETTGSSRRFKGGGFRDARRQFSLLATLFGVIGQFDQNVRWQVEAAAMRDALARAGFNSKAGSDQTYREAKARADELALMVRGGSPDLPEPEAEWKWPQVSDRQPLMVRMETAQGQMSLWTSSAKEFRQNQDRLLHETQILAMLAEVLKDPGYEYAEDETFQEYVSALQQSCLDLIEAVRQDMFDKAQESAGAVYKSCNACHEDFRG